MQQSSELLYAASEGDLEKCRALIQAGADINAAQHYGSPLHFAAANGNAPLCRLLVDAGALLTLRDTNEFLALTCAARNGHVEVCKLLVDAGADPYALSRGTDSALNLASSLNDGSECEVLRELLAKGIPDDSNRARAVEAMSEALRHFAMKGNAAACKILADAGADISLADHRGWTPLLLAAANNRLDVCTFLIAAGAEPSQAGKCGRGAPLTPFQIAVDSGATAVASYFLDHHGEDCAQLTARGRTMSQLAGKHSQMKQVLKAASTAKSITDAIGGSGETAARRSRPSGPAL
jgi:ankyrin repeat protein